MTLTIQRSEGPTIAIPGDLLSRLQLREGDEVTPVVQEGTLRLTQVDRFLALRGSMAEDDGFDRAMDEIAGAWQSWNSAPTQ